MNFTKTIAIVAFATISNISYCQFDFKNVIEFSVDYGISNDLGARKTHMTAFAENIVIENKTLAKTTNFTLGYTRYLTPKHGIKVSVGLSNYGFDFTGTTDVSNTLILDSYRVMYLEWGLSYIRRVGIAQYANLLFEPGIRFYSDGSPTSNFVFFHRNESLFFSGYAGLEVPMIGSHFFTTIGLQFKMPIISYNDRYNFATADLPYFLGLKIGISFQL